MSQQHYSNLNDTVDFTAKHYTDLDDIDTHVDQLPTNNDNGYEELTLSQPFDSVSTPNSHHTYGAPPIVGEQL
jgi:hypothetical protein